MAEQERSSELAAVVGRKLHDLRLQRELTLERLARISGVSRAMLWQIEQARSAPTITVLARVADALGVPVGAFLDVAAATTAVVMRRNDARVLQAGNGAVSTRALFPDSGARGVEFHEVRLEPGAIERRVSGRDGTFENVVVSEGSVEVDLGTGTQVLNTGDALFFRTESVHSYRNITARPVVLYRVTVFPRAETYASA
jgi:transcriptional regulator with XRE-family HTH domain